MKKYKQLAAIIGIGVVTLLFAYYLHGHPNTIDDLKAISPSVVVIVTLLYGLTLIALVAIYDTTMRLCKVVLPAKENLLLTIYSSIANFFGPLQSGPGVRSVYLKQRYKVKLRSYASATMIYYLMFGIWSGVFLISGIRPWWKVGFIISLGLIMVIGLVLVVRRFDFFKTLNNRSSLELLVRLGLITLLQVSLVSLIYFIELRSVNPEISFSQAVTYTGAANFALFVSLTPGALGFRESFLFFSRELHHISGNDIILANIIDRSTYIFFLGLLIILVVGIHAKDKLTTKPTPLE